MPDTPHDSPESLHPSDAEQPLDPGVFPIPEWFGTPTDPRVVPTDQFTVNPDPITSELAGFENPASSNNADNSDNRQLDCVDPDASPQPESPNRLARFKQHPFRILSVMFVVVGLLVIAAGYLWVTSEANPSGPKGSQVVLSVPKGSGLSGFGSSLQKQGVIGSSLAFRIWISIQGDPGVFTGTYAFNKNDSFSAIRAVLANGPNVFDLEVLPGFTVSEVATRVGRFPGHDETSFNALATGGSVHSPWQPAGGTNLDGLLGTGSYRLLPGETDTQLLEQMIARFNAQANAAGLSSRAAALGLTSYQAIIVASIVEKEGVIRKNLGPVARVILNRLAKGMPLQMDSTVLYSEGRDGGPVTSKDLKLQTPYNTYLHPGLTPTPICFASPAVLAAALNPPPGTWLFFVVVESDGTEAFADTFAQQKANEAVAAQRGLS